MEFPIYVPNAVRVLVAGRLEGEDGFKSWNLELADAKTKVAQLEQERRRPGHDGAAATKLRIECAEAIARRDDIAEDVACLERLVHDWRMRPVYASLVDVLGTDDQMAGFIDAAWAARMDYGKNRQQIKNAVAQVKKVAEVAGLLDGLLRESEQFGELMPSEFFSVTALLKKTDHDATDRNADIWPGMRRLLLGDSLGLSDVQVRDVDRGDAEIIDVGEAARNQIRRAWDTAPSMACIVSALRREASAYVPKTFGFVGAALASRKRNQKYEYLRAFGAMLHDDQHIELTTEIINAAMTTATVVLGNSIDVTQDEVRKAFASLTT